MVPQLSTVKLPIFVVAESTLVCGIASDAVLRSCVLQLGH